MSAPSSSEPGASTSPTNASNGSRKRRSDHLLGHDLWEEFYDIEWFLDRAAVQDYLCSVCGYIVKEATETVCGHIFCHRCIRQALEVKRECPMCRRSLPYYTGPGATVHFSQVTDRVIGRQMVRCVNHDGGCGWKGCFSDLKRHIVECAEHYLVCPNAAQGCAERYPRRRAEHHSSRCEYALIPCPKACGTDVPRGNMDAHIADDCPNVRVDCPHGCPVRSMLRAELHTHLNSLCPLQIIACPFSTAGCAVMLQRGLLEDHMKEASAEHLQGALGALQDAKQEIHRLSQEVGAMKAAQKKSGGLFSLFRGICRSSRR